MSKPSVFDLLRREHRLVLSRIAVLEKSAAPGAARGHRARRNQDVAQVTALLERQFATHMSAEDEVLFPALVKVLPETRASIVPLQAEHAELRSILAGLQASLRRPPGASRDQQIAVQARDLVDLLRIHIRKEEAVIFGVAERVLPPLEVARLAARRLREKPAVSTPRIPTNRAKGQQ